MLCSIATTKSFLSLGLQFPSFPTDLPQPNGRDQPDQDPEAHQGVRSQGAGPAAPRQEGRCRWWWWRRWRSRWTARRQHQPDDHLRARRTTDIQLWWIEKVS